MDNVTISPSQFQEGLRRMMEASGKWSRGNTWVGEEPPTEDQYVMWVDMSGEKPKLRFQTPTGAWQEISGSGGGGTSAGGVLIEPLSSVEQSISTGDKYEVALNWSSANSDKVKGNITVYVNSARVYLNTHDQGEFRLDVTKYLSSGKTNEVKVVVRDLYGSENYQEFNISVIAITIASSYKQNTIIDKSIFNGAFYAIPLTVKSGIDTTVYAKVDRGDEPLSSITENPTSSITVSAGDTGVKEILIPTCSHGSHTLEILATAKIGEGSVINSNKLFYDLIWVEEGNPEVIIASPFDMTEADQYEILEIPYFVIDPTSNLAKVYYEVNGELLSEEPAKIPQRENIWDTSGSLPDQDNNFAIISGTTIKTFKVYLNKVETVNVVPVTESMPLCLIAEKQKSNIDTSTREVWQSTGEAPDIVPVFKNFNWNTNGWFTVNNKGALKISDGASLEIPYKIFAGDNVSGFNTNIRDVGCTVELDVSFDNVTDVDKAFFSCMLNGRGIEITPNQAKLSSSGISVKTLFSDTDSKTSSMRFSFVITPEDPGIAYIYLNGVGAAANIYEDTDRFKHERDEKNGIEPADITFSSEGCTVILHSLRVYRKPLTSQEVMRNWIFDMARISDQFNAQKRNKIYDEFNNISYSAIKERIPCMIITGKMPTYKGDKQIVDIKFEGTKDAIFDFILKQAQIDVQGTSSQYYPYKNWKFKSKYKITDDVGTVIAKPEMKFEMLTGNDKKYALADDQIPATVFCLKADYMESSSTHNTVTANIANGMYTEKTPPQKADASGKTRTTVYGRPIVVFYRETENSDLVFGGKYNFNYDKDAEDVFGFVEDSKYEVVECVEFRNNTNTRCLLSESEYVNREEPDPLYEGDVGADGKIPAYLNAFEWRYYWRRDKSNNIEYDYLKAATDWIVTTDRRKATGKELPQPYETSTGIALYLYDENMDIITFLDSDGVTRRAIDIGLGNLEYSVEHLESYTKGEDGALVPLYDRYEDGELILDDEGNPIHVKYYALPVDKDGVEKYSFTHDTETYRLTKFKNELPEHFNVHYCLMYYLLMDLLGMIDSSTKNCFWATWGERHEKHADPEKDKVVIWYPIFYDMDTMLGLSNMGKMDIPYNAEFNSLMPGSDSSYVFNGHDNVFWNNIKDAYITELNRLFRSKVSDGVFSQQSILGAYESHSENFPEALYNEDGNYKLISPYVDGYFGYSEDSPDEMVLQHPDYVYIYQGNRYYHRRSWFPNRYNYVCSKNMAGSYITDYITMRLNTPDSSDLAVAPNSNFTVTTFADQYTRVKYGSKTVFSRCTHNKPTEIEAPPDTYNDTETIIYGASRIMDIGDLSDKYARSIDLSKGKRLTIARVGSDAVNSKGEVYRNENLDTINFGSNPMVREVYVQNCPRLEGTLNLKECPSVRLIRAHGTSIDGLSLPSPGILESATLPETMTSIRVIDNPNFTDLRITPTNPVHNEDGDLVDYDYNLQDMIVENSPIDTQDLVEHSPGLTRMRLIGIDWHLDTDDLLHHIMNNCAGFDANYADSEKAVLLGDCTVSSVKDYIAKGIHKYFNNNQEFDSLDQGDFKLYVDHLATTRVVRFFNQPRPEDTPVKLESGITDDRVLDISEVHTSRATYSGATPLKSEDWSRTYEFESWGVYINGVLTPVKLEDYPISADTDFYAMYAETKKPFTLKFYSKNFKTGAFDIFETKTIYYDTGYSPQVLPDDILASDEYAYRFHGWSTTKNSEVADIPCDRDANECGMIAVVEGTPYEQSYYPVYTLDHKYYVTFKDHDREIEEVYYTGDSVDVPTNPAQWMTTSHVYDFSGWVCNGITYQPQYIPEIGGSDYDLVYEASYNESLRPYTIRFLNEDNSEIQSTSVEYGKVPDKPSDRTKPITERYEYTFQGWKLQKSDGSLGSTVYTSIPQVTGDATYVAYFTSTVRTYLITFVDGNGTVIQSSRVEHNLTPSYTGSTPTKTATAQYYYTWNNGWSPAITSVRADATYTATFTKTVQVYTVTYKNYDGTTLQTISNVPYGTTASYTNSSDKLTKPATTTTVYTFSGWSPAVGNITGNTVYTAQYTDSPRYYDVTWQVDGLTSKTVKYQYGQTPTPPSGYTIGTHVSSTDKYIVTYGTIYSVTKNQAYTATTKGVATKTGLNWSSTGIGSDTYNGSIISNMTPTGFNVSKDTWTTGLTNIYRYINIDTSEAFGLSADTTIQSITVNFNCKSSNAGASYSKVALWAHGVTTEHTVQVDDSRTSITVDLNSQTAAALLKSGTISIGFGLRHSAVLFVDVEFSNVSFDITYHV